MSDEDFDDGFGEEKYNLESEVNARERAGIGRMSDFLSGIVGPEQKIGKETSAEDRFIIFMNATARKLKQDGVNISEGDIDNMLEKTRMVIELKYKNPTAYILGYLASQGGKTMDKARVKYVIKDVLPKLGKDSGVEPPDVIRYARYWKNIL